MKSASILHVVLAVPKTSRETSLIAFDLAIGMQSLPVLCVCVCVCVCGIWEGEGERKGRWGLAQMVSPWAVVPSQGQNERPAASGLCDHDAHAACLVQRRRIPGC